MSAQRTRLGYALAVLLAGGAPTRAQTAEPEPLRGLMTRRAGAQPGYTLISPLASTTTYLLDLEGALVRTWTSAHPPAAMAYLLDDGHLLRSARVADNPRFFGGGLGGRIQEFDLEGRCVWDFVLSDEQGALHHDLEVLPNGNVLAIHWEYVAPAAARALGRMSQAVSDSGWWPDVVVELARVGTHGARVVWEWRAREHLVQDQNADWPTYGEVPDAPGRIDVNFDARAQEPSSLAAREERRRVERKMRELGYSGGEAAEPDQEDRREPDWMHTNGLDYHARYQLIVACSPHMNEVFVIDHSTTTEEARGSSGGRWGHGGDLLWRWGNAANYGRALPAQRQLFYPHDPQWLDGSDGSLRLLVFNNGQERTETESWSSVDELVLPFDPARGFVREGDRPWGPREPTWSYTAPQRTRFYAPFVSGAQRLANGNTLVCDGPAGRVFELDSDGEIVWDYRNPHGGEVSIDFGRASRRQVAVDPKALFQATRLSPDHPGVRALLAAK